MQHRRNQWKDKAKQRGERERYQRQQMARITAERNRLRNALKETQARRQTLEAQRPAVATRPQVDVIHLALPLF